MASRSKILRDAYVNGFEIVVVGGPVNPNRLDGYYPVIYQPRSCRDKSPWIRVDGPIPFRYHAGELKDIHTRATKEHAARKATEEADKRRKAYMSRDTMEGILASSRAKGELDPYWWRMS